MRENRMTPEKAPRFSIIQTITQTSREALRRLLRFFSQAQVDHISRHSQSKDNISWRPDYLDSSVLATFIVVFLGLSITFEVLLHKSTENYGLATSSANFHYLWTYGPTAILTLVASFWVRVEYQTKISAPWCRMLRGPTPSRQSLLLDYVSQFQPLTIFAAIKNKDYAVAAAASISLLLRLVIVLSTSFIVLVPTQIPMSGINVTLTRQFADDPSGLSTSGALAYSSISTFMTDGIPMPDGIAANFAYQSATTDVLNTLELTTIVDGFSGDLHCEPATAFPVGAISYKEEQVWDLAANLTFRLKTDDCEMMVTGNCGRDITTCYNFGMLSGVCDGSSSTKNKRIAILASAINFDTFTDTIDTPDDDTQHANFTIMRVNAFICTPFYEIQPVKVVQRDSETHVSLIANAASRQLDSALSWDIMQSYLDEISYRPFLQFLSNVSVNFDKYSAVAYEFANYTHSVFIPNLPSIFAGDSIVQLISNYHKQYVAILARVSLMNVSSLPSNGSVLVSEDRLLIQVIPTHVMTGLLLLSVIMVILVWWKQYELLLLQEPTTIIGNAVLLAHNPLSNLIGLGSASVLDLGAILDRWVYKVNDAAGAIKIPNQQLPLLIDSEARRKPSTYRPVSLSVIFRSFALFIISTGIVILEISLRKSTRENGIADSPTENSKYSLWTVGPGLFAAIVGMYTASVDSDTRVQSPLLRLRQGVTFNSLSLDLVDRHTSTLIHEELRSRSFEALSSTLALTFTSLLGVFSASLFYAAAVPVESLVQLKVNSLIYNGDSIRESNSPNAPSFMIATLVLLQNASYPALTYEDLALPGLELVDDTSLPNFNHSNVTFKVTVPAARPDFVDCKLYGSDQIITNVETSASDRIGISSDLSATHLNISIQPEIGCYFGGAIQISGPTSTHDRIYFGSVHTACSSFLWVWGSWLNAPLNDTKARRLSVSALGCNDTVQIVDASVQIHAQTMLVDPNEPPIPNYETAVILDSNYSRTVGPFYNGLPPVSAAANDTIIDPFFTIITRSKHAVPISYLGDASKASKVADAIRYHHRIFVVQDLNLGYRRRNNDSVFDSWVPVGNNATIFNATAHDPTGHGRVLQDVASTRILQSLFLATFICLVVNWFLMRNINEVPRSPTSIANWIALLADGNLDDFLPPNASHMPLDQISRWYFGQDAVFSLGYRESEAKGDKALGIYVEKKPSNL
ncbi:hypothetical protein F4860DRAFT_495963 [Xylaria cubensis]|nr:hypothetical protein F4860DRAFT_495963 [Xylaria cubensis]